MINTKYNTVLGKRFFNKDEVIRVLGYNNGHVKVAKDNNYHETESLLASELSDYQIMTPDLVYVFVHITTNKTNDVLYYVLRKEDFSGDAAGIPYMISRQMITESQTHTNITLGSYIYGKKYTKEETNLFLHCDEIIETVMVSSYVDDNPDTIAKIAFNAFSCNINRILDDNVIEFTKNSRKKNFIGHVNGPTSLKALMAISQKVVDSGIGIDYTFDKDNEQEVNMVLGMITDNYSDLDVILFKPDIDLDQITSHKFLMRNKSDGNVYLYTYSTAVEDPFK